MKPKTLVTLIRQLGKMTQQEVAEATGLKQSMISKIERDKVKDIMNGTYLPLFTLYHEIISGHRDAAITPLTPTNNK